jgi:hypothetical protein
VCIEAQQEGDRILTGTAIAKRAEYRHSVLTKGPVRRKNRELASKIIGFLAKSDVKRVVKLFGRDASNLDQIMSNSEDHRQIDDLLSGAFNLYANRDAMRAVISEDVESLLRCVYADSLSEDRDTGEDVQDRLRSYVGSLKELDRCTPAYRSLVATESFDFCSRDIYMAAAILGIRRETYKLDRLLHILREECVYPAPSTEEGRRVAEAKQAHIDRLEELKTGIVGHFTADNVVQTFSSANSVDRVAARVYMDHVVARERDTVGDVSDIAFLLGDDHVSRAKAACRFARQHVAVVEVQEIVEDRDDDGDETKDATLWLDNDAVSHDGRYGFCNTTAGNIDYPVRWVDVCGYVKVLSDMGATVEDVAILTGDNGEEEDGDDVDE